MRLDVYLTEKLNIKSRTVAKDLIAKGKVLVGGEMCTKSAKNVDESSLVQVVELPRFASKGGEKLEKGILSFNFDPSGKTFLDVGASNGGFTHCLLLHGAKKVYAIDVGENQLEEFLQKDERVIVMDKTNAKTLKKEMFVEKELFAVSDVSFISLTYIIQSLSKFVREGLFLIKPQFECGKKALNKNGIVTHFEDRLHAVTKIRDFGAQMGLNLSDIAIARQEKGKNTEYIAHFDNKEPLTDEQIYAKICEK